MKPNPSISLLAVLALALPAAAQLDLPDKPKKGSGDGGTELERRPRGDLRPGPKRPGTGASPDLGPPPAVPATGEPDAAEPTPAPQVPASAGEAILEHLAGQSSPNTSLVADAVRSLVSMGDEGYALARAALDREEPGVLLAAMGTLLAGGAAPDRFLVQRRLERKLPGRAAGPAVDMMADLPPDLALPALIDLCDHRQGNVRRRAAERLAQAEAGLPTSALVQLASASRSDTRRLAYGLMSDELDRGRDELAEYLLLGLDDSSARAAQEAGAALSGRIEGPGDPLVGELLLLMRLRSMDDRRGAFAMLALADAEDRLGTALVPFDESTTLLVTLRGGSPFVTAASAVLLAGLGFRSEEPCAWLDQEVSGYLIQAVSGDLYFPEYAVVRPPALRRLQQLTGRDLGDDGPRWRAWWVGEMKDFRALRAVLPLAAPDHAGLEVRWFDPVSATSFRLLGSLAPDQAEPYAGRTLRLVPADSERLYALLDTAGLFGAERLPGLLGLPSGVEPRLELRHGRQAKTFRFGAGARAPWREDVVAGLLELESAAAWQLYPSAEFGLTDEGREAFFRAESPWWAAERDAGARAERLGDLILDHLTLLPPEQRDRPLMRFRALADEHGFVATRHFDPLARLLADEAFLGRRGRDLLDLCLQAGSDPLLEGRLSVEHAGALVDLLYVSGDRLEPLVLVYERAPRPLRLEAATDPRPGIRSVAAAVLANEEPEPGQDALDRLGALLADPELQVESAAVLAVSGAGLGQFRDEVFLRARVGDPLVRVAALRGVARLGGAGALDVLRTAVLESEPMVRTAAAEALAELADPASATLLTQMFAGGEGGPFFDASRRGLAAIGEPAWDGLLVLARSRTSPARKDAALLLAEQGVPQVASVLTTMLTEDPSDSDVAAELAILTGRDFRDQPDPAGAWWAWSDGVGSQGDSIDWFVAAITAEIEAGLALDLVDVGLDAAEIRAGSRAGAEGLVRYLEVGAEGHREKRAQRELERILGPSLGAVPPPGSLRQTWCGVLLERMPELLPEPQVEGAAGPEVAPVAIETP